MRRSIFLAPVFVAALVAALVPAAARADGLPVLGVDVGSSGVSSGSEGDRYVTIPAGSRTIVERVAQDGGQVLAWRSLPGTFTIPAVAYDGSAGGLSADGTTLVLIEPRTSVPRTTTRLLVLGSAYPDDRFATKVPALMGPAARACLHSAACPVVVACPIAA